MGECGPIRGAVKQLDTPRMPFCSKKSEKIMCDSFGLLWTALDFGDRSWTRCGVCESVRNPAYCFWRSKVFMSVRRRPRASLDGVTATLVLMPLDLLMNHHCVSTRVARSAFPPLGTQVQKPEYMYSIIERRAREKLRCAAGVPHTVEAGLLMRSAKCQSWLERGANEI